MENLKNSFTAISQFFKSLNSKTKENTANSTKAEFTATKFGMNVKQTAAKGNEQSSLFHQMYAVENETLFI